MRGAPLLFACSLAGCLASELPPDQYIARHHACTQLEGQSFRSSVGGRVSIAMDDVAYSTYEWTHLDDSVTTGLVQCEDATAATLLFVDVAKAVSGRAELSALGRPGLTWYGMHFDAAVVDSF